MANLAFKADYYDVAWTVDQWSTAEEPYRQSLFPTGTQPELVKQLNTILETDMPNRWDSFQTEHKAQRRAAAAQQLLHMVFDSRRVVMCHSMWYLGASIYGAAEDSRFWLRDAIKEIHPDNIDQTVYGDNYQKAFESTTKPVSINKDKGIKQLVAFTLGLTCTYITLQLDQKDFFFPAPTKAIGDLQPYDEFEYYRVR